MTRIENNPDSNPVRQTVRLGALPARAAAFALVVLAMTLTAGCATRARSIADLSNNPGRYYDKTVTVEGTVTSSWGVPMMALQVYRISDGTGELTVLSQRNRVPGRGARVRVTGEVDEVAMLGGRSIGLHIKERRLSVLRD
jgi:hypothetical protein